MATDPFTLVVAAVPSPPHTFRPPPSWRCAGNAALERGRGGAVCADQSGPVHHHDSGEVGAWARACVCRGMAHMPMTAAAAAVHLPRAWGLSVRRGRCSPRSSEQCGCAWRSCSPPMLLAAHPAPASPQPTSPSCTQCGPPPSPSLQPSPQTPPHPHACSGAAAQATSGWSQYEDGDIYLDTFSILWERLAFGGASMWAHYMCTIPPVLDDLPLSYT